PGKGDVVAGVGIPVPIEGAEAGGGEGLVDGGEMCQPGEPPGERFGVMGQPRREALVDKTRVGRAAPVVHEPRDWRKTRLTDERQSLVGPAPVVVGSARARRPLPEDWVAERADSQVGNAPKVV